MLRELTAMAARYEGSQKDGEGNEVEKGCVKDIGVGCCREAGIGGESGGGMSAW